MDSIIAKALDKIARLKNLADQPGTPGEAAAATAAIQRLMLRHGLSQADVRGARLDRTEGFANEDFDLGGNNYWRKTLFNAVADYMFCRAVFDHKGRGVSVVGRPENVTVATNLYAYLVDAINRLADTGVGTSMSVRIGTVTPRKYKNSFRNGAVVEMANRLKALRRENVASEQASALVVVEDAALERAWRHFHADARERINRSTSSSGIAHREGQAAARGINLADQITG